MSKEVTFDLTLKFSDKIVSDDDIEIIANNIATAIWREANNYGIAPEDSDVCLENLTVNNPLSGVKIGR